MSTTEHLKSEIERTAKATKLKPTTIGRMVGQGGHFYRRLCAGKRVWPETADAVLAQLEGIRETYSAPQKEAS